jgi:hypothetical protein
MTAMTERQKVLSGQELKVLQPDCEVSTACPEEDYTRSRLGVEGPNDFLELLVVTQIMKEREVLMARTQEHQCRIDGLLESSPRHGRTAHL